MSKYILCGCSKVFTVGMNNLNCAKLRIDEKPGLYHVLRSLVSAAYAEQ